MEEKQTTPHKRRVRYSGTHPKKFEEKYKELNPEKYQEDVAKIRQSGKKIIIMSIMSPVYAERLSWADTILLGYSWSNFTFKGLFGTLSGEYKPTGKAPFNN